ncbi:sugar transferase [Mangrovivirga cuniculi]|uniref:Lipid carrier--UDP-N-acetylgalactosaminyltransferase n=1 Tax=Mangrovivirga cuniculi TaxID=2715131 RepID=A0A4D7JQW6_9BACT|nr:sugar transferase [Mangrovivirga cuniculi]QCK15900.1 lipid carrier--UDP-N-acetylgalactosaminyltransferase [Mangrovivirga cuniculi]
MYRDFFKRLIDFTLSLIGLIIASPIFLIVWILLALSQNGKAFFVQPRPGKNGEIFKLIKFKTMNDATDQEGNLLPDEQRLHGLGKFVRKTSLDELPQLVNVLKGDMSLIGPRPLLIEYLPLYSNEQARRHEVRPGITGWAQVNGRNAISWEKKFEYDVFYVENLSFTLDLKILILTIKKVFVAEGINSNTSVTMEKFKGSEN